MDVKGKKLEEKGEKFERMVIKAIITLGDIGRRCVRPRVVFIWTDLTYSIMSSFVAMFPSTIR